MDRALRENKPRVAAATMAHVKALAGNIRQADLDELAALMPVSAGCALEMSFKSSTVCWVGLVNNEPICLFGVSPASFFSPGKGRPWMIGAKSLDKHAIIFLRRCKRQVEQMAALYPHLENYVDSRNTLSIRWLEWLGFTLCEALPVGMSDVPFYRFEMKGVSCACQC